MSTAEQGDPVLKETAGSKSSHELYDLISGSPPAMHHAASDPIASQSETSYEVRPCRVEDTASIDTIMRKAWPDEPEWRNPQYWTKQFIKPTSERFGYVIQEVGGNHNDDANTYQHQVIGFAIYKWSQPSFQRLYNYGYNWYINDFNTDKFEWKYGFNNKTTYNNINAVQQYYNNQNLKQNWNKLSTHIVHITDVAIHPHQRGKGMGTQLMQSMIYSFPNGTRFGLEVKCENMGGIKCYQKCGFVIKRTMPHYYGRNKSAHKMVLVSRYTDDDVSNFIKTTQLKRSEKERENVRKQLEDFHINNVKSKVCNNSKEMEETEEKKDIEMTDKYCNKTDKIEKGLKHLCGDDWTFYFQNFCAQGVYDDHLIALKEDDLKKLIPKIGPRSRVRLWIKQLKAKR